MSDERPRGNRHSVTAGGSREEAPDGPFQEQEEAVAGPRKLRKLAGWYREFAERTGNPMIWEARLRTAEDLDAEAERIERAASDRD